MTAVISSMRRRGLKRALKRTAALALALACGLSFAGVTTSAQARSLTMALASEPQSLDPLFSRTQNNMQTAENMFERLIEQDDNLQVRPGLAVSWRAVDPLTWEFHLRPNVRFSDNSPMTAADVAYSLRRARSVPNSPAPYSGAVANIERIEVVDPLTLRIVTKTPSPAFVEQIGLVYIVSQQATAGHASNDYRLPAVAVGTGPYRLARWIPGDRLELVRNEHYWGKRPIFDTCTIRFVSNDAARLSALLSGSVDLIDNVPPVTIGRLRREPNVTLFSGPSARLIYLALDSSRDASPFVAAADGSTIARNPLRDVRVREAISKMIDRDAITQHLLNGAGLPAAQIVPPGMGGYDPQLQPDRYDPVGARRLLTAAGYPDGFRLTIHSSNDRFASDGDLGQALGQMLARGGIAVNDVVTQPYNVYAGAAARRSYSAFIFSFGNTTSDSAIALTNVLESYSRESGTGAFNRTRYSNPTLDRLLREAAASFDPARRNELLQQAARAGFGDYGIVPLYFPVDYWATRKGVIFHPNKSERTSLLFIETQP
ncbi:MULTISPECIES: ABC transporter substrate-binding protein [Paraburkholderia]|uniref:ABC transporter substrate-binding protein n=1 Tax=Paraburkholderia TaxID=1822464 RepID=UPI001B238C5D|nr:MULTISPECIES: ABC transporter substrate-binding protein [Paraburkholderia]MCX4152604.1 ABC transporter substrate-binding protein [Paraburkholderia aspalathi]MDN7162019.1 ABC transporter substrate-binding protein [Paraburkholderia sp. SECH2]MDQ6390505.1 ABC transporter substrate-binding protein [Paraburkholderia aspalathi]CAE6716792.1 Glutathione-binding protein GsiB [Paraburkholderia aspalathi]